MTLLLIRHAHAGQGDPADPDDHLRPLSRKGERQAEALDRACTVLGLRFHRLFASPYTRAAATAAPLTRHTRGGRLELLGELTGDDYAGLLAALRHTLGPDDTTDDTNDDTIVGLVGHEPYLSGLTSILLCGEAARVRTRFRKGMMVRLGGSLTPGGMALEVALTPALIRRLAAS